MKYLKMLGLAAFPAMALMAFASAGTASATTLEVGGVTKNEAVTISASLKPGTTMKLRDTFFFGINSCTDMDYQGTSTTVTGTYVTGPLSTLDFTGCTHPVTVHKLGKFYIHWVSGTNGDVYSEEAEWTELVTTLGETINCKTGTGTRIGTLTGTASGNAEIDINASLTCVRANGGHLTAKWEGTTLVTSPSGLGVSA